jgi:hypothetical protein
MKSNAATFNISEGAVNVWNLYEAYLNVQITLAEKIYTRWVRPNAPGDSN